MVTGGVVVEARCALVQLDSGLQALPQESAGVRIAVGREAKELGKASYGIAPSDVDGSRREEL